MTQENNLIKIYTGTELTATYLKEELDSKGIGSIIKNDFQSGISAGFGGGIPSAIDLYIQESDFEKADPIVKEFIKNMTD